MKRDTDFGLAAFYPADSESARGRTHIRASDLTVLAEHHTDGTRSQSFLVAHDGSVTWGVPGEPQLVAIKIERDLDERMYTFETASHACIPFAQNWLIERGCPPASIAQGDGFLAPADDLTIRVEEQIRASADRYELLDSQCWDDPCESWTLVRDSSAAQAPIRVFLDTGDLVTTTYTMREGAFPDEHAARDWLDERDGPLPDPPEYHGDAAALRAGAALSRSTGPVMDPQAGLATRSRPTAGPRPAPGRSL
ncbi:glycosyl hydrolase [Streptomyces sp. So13.3]|uniref:glycosyl hydrolase n=1 Tax=unclassified Streptomyces TaxID=2593676 RepID=UPI0011062960|nr:MULTISPECIES: glycosyl hydrolase [unclassified Streptomyces]NEA75440.1 glycosyl hydrolase [Streptomyces sp. SID13588]QNA73130.1 glycosyl hydrolase [Streptomyces sp. So13.3]